MYLALKLLAICNLLAAFFCSNKLSYKVQQVLSSIFLLIENLFFGIQFLLFSIVPLKRFRHYWLFKALTASLIVGYFYWEEIIQFWNYSFLTFYDDQKLFTNESWLGLTTLCLLFQNSNNVSPKSIFLNARTFNNSQKESFLKILLIILFCDVMYAVTQKVFSELVETNIVQTWIGIFSFTGILIGFRKIFFDDANILKWFKNVLERIIPIFKSPQKTLLYLILIPLMVKLPLHHWALWLVMAIAMQFPYLKKLKWINTFVFFIGFAPIILSPTTEKYIQILSALFNPLGMLRYYNELYLTHAIGIDLVTVPFFAGLYFAILKYPVRLPNFFSVMEPILFLILLTGLLI